MKTVLNHLSLSLKNKQCFMCKHFKGDLSGKGGALDVPEKCTLLKVSKPFNWVEYYAKYKYPRECLSICEGKHFKAGGECMKIYNRVKFENKI